MTSHPRLIYEFGEFQLEPDTRKLLRGGQIVPLQGKACDLLLVLIHHRGELLTKDDLLGLVWPDQIVEESNLTVNMSAIRRALGERAGNPHYITTVSGRGYRFNGEVRQRTDETLTIERESFTRLTVEQEESTIAAPLAGQAATALSKVMAHPVVLLMTLAFVLAIAGIGLWVKGRHRNPTAPLAWSHVTLHRFVTQGGIPYRVAISPDGKSLIYRQRINGRDSMWLGRVADNSSVMIRNDPDVSVQNLAFAPDGQSVYLIQRNLNESQTRLVRLPLLGGVATEVTARIDSGITFSPDGSQIAFLRNDREAKQSVIVTANASDGKSERVIASLNSPARFTGEGLSWAPDGKSIAVVATSTGDRNHSEILAVRVADGVHEKLSSAGWGVVGQLVWLNDQSGLLVTRRENIIARKNQIWFVPYPAGEPRKITSDLDIYQGNSFSVSANGRIAVLRAHLTSEIRVAPGGDVARSRSVFSGVEPGYEGVDGLAWAADGHLLYSAYVGDGQAIWQVDGDGRNARQLTTNKADVVDRHLSMTSDGRYIVFHSNRSGSFQIWRANSDGTNLKQLTNTDANTWPALSPDGHWIVYACEHAAGSALCRIGIDGGDPALLTEDAGTRPVVSPDGQYIAYFKPMGSQVRIVIVPFSGGAALKTFDVANTVFASDMVWAPDGKSIIYRDAFLGVWRQPLDDKSKPLPGFEDKEVYQFAWSPDGKNLAYSTGLRMQEIVLIDKAD
ncbi:MAG TPA: winged helix-turn-helix domain-containing protein [Pyrinomonadaceae bacterium]|nr:winged helix-turn-helix domain-containing protein [Pyrinomonadaceae bacterium]